MATFKMVGTLPMHETRQKIDQSVVGGSVTGQVLFQNVYGGTDHKVMVVVYEKYYYRANNRVSLTVVIEEKDGETFVDATSTGGGQGIIFRFSWGAETSFAKIVVNTLTSTGFRLV